MLRVKFKAGSSVFVGYLDMFYYKGGSVWYIVEFNGRRVHTKGAIAYE